MQVWRDAFWVCSQTLFKKGHCKRYLAMSSRPVGRRNEGLLCHGKSTKWNDIVPGGTQSQSHMDDTNPRGNQARYHAQRRTSTNTTCIVSNSIQEASEAPAWAARQTPVILFQSASLLLWSALVEVPTKQSAYSRRTDCCSSRSWQDEGYHESQ